VYPFYNFGANRIEITSNSSSIIACLSVTTKHCQFRSNAAISTSVSVAADTHFSEPLSRNGLLLISGVMSQYYEDINRPLGSVKNGDFFD
jgi:hypothetical protein